MDYPGPPSGSYHAGVSSINGLPPILPPAPSAVRTAPSAVRTAPLRLEEAASVDAPVARIAPSQPIDPLVAGRLAPGARLTLRPNFAQIQATYGANAQTPHTGPETIA